MDHPKTLKRGNPLAWRRLSRPRAARATARAVGVAVALLGLALGCTSLKLRFREPGEVLETFPEPVAEEYHCDKRPLPYFTVEKNELIPHRVKPGSEFNHRMVYILCPENPTQVVSGKLDTRILFKGKPIFAESIDHELKPGRWRVDTFIPIDAEVAPGIYALEIGFASKDGNFTKLSTFAVEASQKKADAE